MSSSNTCHIPVSPLTGFSRVDWMMIAARAKYASNPTLVAKIRADAIAKLHKDLPPTPESLDFDERVDRAIARSENLLGAAMEQLNKPVSAHLPAELTLAEQAEKAANEEWDAGYAVADMTTDSMLQGSQTLFDEVMESLDEVTSVPNDVTVPSPPPSPALEWLNVPGEVKQWTAESKKSFREYRDTMHSAARQCITSEQMRTARQLDATTTDLYQARELSQAAERGEISVPELIAHYDAAAPSVESRQAAKHRVRAIGCEPNLVRFESFPKYQARSLRNKAQEIEGDQLAPQPTKQSKQGDRTAERPTRRTDSEVRWQSIWSRGVEVSW